MVDSILKKLGIFIPILLTIVLAFSIIPNTSAQTELFYDDGGDETCVRQDPNHYAAVKFTNPWSSCKILTARYFICPDASTFNLHIFNSDGSIRLFGPLAVTPTSTGWFDVDLIPYDIQITGDFMVAIEWVSADPHIGRDENNVGHTYVKTTGDWIFSDKGESMIRAVVEEVGNPVGGIYAPTNRLSILTPYIALVGLIGAISTIFAIRKWRKD
jgi:hypothetical protein